MKILKPMFKERTDIKQGKGDEEKGKKKLERCPNVLYNATDT